MYSALLVCLKRSGHSLCSSARPMMLTCCSLSGVQYVVVFFCRYAWIAFHINIIIIRARTNEIYNHPHRTNYDGCENCTARCGRFGTTSSKKCSSSIPTHMAGMAEWCHCSLYALSVCMFNWFAVMKKCDYSTYIESTPDRTHTHTHITSSAV